MARVQLTMAMSYYDHVADLLHGRVQPEGIELVCLNFSVEEIFWRFAKYQEWDISEMSSSNYVSLISRQADILRAIPVFPSRVFRCSSIYVRRGGGISRPEQLAGKRVGVPEWVQTAGIYARGYLMHECGLHLEDIEWYQGGVSEPGREEKVAFEAPGGVKIKSVRDRSLTELLESGQIEAIITAHPPKSFGHDQGERSIVRLWPDFQAVEQAYWRKTGIFPIMHLLAIRTEVLRRHPWVAMNLYKAFAEAKERSIQRLSDMTASRFALPWGPQAVDQMRGLFAGEYWPYGIEPNRVTLEAFLQYCFEQGVSPRKLKVEELFVPEVQTSFKV